jgi:Tol biopolymer transport system component
VLYAISIVDRGGLNPRQVTSYRVNTNHPVWSPDGKQLAFSAGFTAVFAPG